MGWQKRFGLALGLLSAVDVILLIFRVLLTGTHRYSFIPWNLLLAWLSFALTIIFAQSLRRAPWISWPNIGLGLLWLVLLPNTFYVLTDFVHVASTAEISQLYDIVLVCLLVFIGFALGIANLFMVHRELLRRLSASASYAVIEAVILISSFAIYLGRDLRWNTWDVVANPGGVLVNVSDNIDPFGNPRAFNVTFLFFVLISSIYLAFWIFTYPSKSRN